MAAQFLHTQFRVRAAMALIAVIALAFGVAFEFYHHATRDRLLKATIVQYREAATHMMRADECRGATAARLPYTRLKRRNELSSDPCPRGNASVPPEGFRSWEAEYSHHQYWGTRIYNEPRGLPEEQLRALDAKLILP